jgi:drug/metabolite transporter (DMT)-like permease
MRLRIWLAVLAAGAGMGTGGVSVRAALHEGVPPYALTLYRGLFAAAVVIGMMALRRRRPAMGSPAWRVGVVMGIASFGIPYILWTLALEHASAGFVGLLSALIPIGTAVIAHFFLVGEPLRLNRLAGLVVALVGVAVLLLVGDSGLAQGGRPLAAGLLTIAAVAMSCSCGVFAKRHAGTYDPIEVSAIQFLVGCAVIGVVTLVAEGVPGAFTAHGWWLLAYSGVVTTGIPVVLYFWLLQRVSATCAAITGYVIPVFAVLSGAVILGERLEVGIAAGGALILAGLVLTDRAEAGLARARG